MITSNKRCFCGLPGLRIIQLFTLKRLHTDLVSWFWNSRWYFTHKARIGIRYACELIKLQKDDQILMPAYNCGSEIDPVIKTGALVNLYNVHKTSMIDINDLESRITKKTKAVYITHYFGFPQQVEKIKELCRSHDIYLIEDCALTLFSRDGSVKIGTSGDIAVFSLTKTLPVPDGGIIVVNNSNLLKEQWSRKRPDTIIILEGILPLLKSRLLKVLSESSSTYQIYILLFNLLNSNQLLSNYKKITRNETLPDILPSMYYNDSFNDINISAITKRLLRSFDINQIITKRRRNFSLFLSLVDGHSEIQPLFKKLPEGICPLNFPVIVGKRNELQLELNKLSIDGRSWWKGFHRELPWEKFPEACFLKKNLLALPIHQDLSTKDIKYIAKTLKSLV